jgi:hypothetical protein
MIHASPAYQVVETPRWPGGLNALGDHNLMGCPPPLPMVVLGGAQADMFPEALAQSDWCLSIPTEDHQLLFDRYLLKPYPSFLAYILVHQNHIALDMQETMHVDVDSLVDNQRTAISVSRTLTAQVPGMCSRKCVEACKRLVAGRHCADVRRLA